MKKSEINKYIDATRDAEDEIKKLDLNKKAFEASRSLIELSYALGKREEMLKELVENGDIDPDIYTLCTEKHLRDKWPLKNLDNRFYFSACDLDKIARDIYVSTAEC